MTKNWYTQSQWRVVDTKNQTVEVAAGNNLNNKFYNYKLY